ncbi:MAG: trimethylamine methyltransferase family protein, partial [Pseudomonadota bacterium]
FYEPLIASYANYGLWEEQGKLRAEERATQKWQHILDEFTPPRVCDGIAEKLAPFVERRTSEGGAPILE